MSSSLVLSDIETKLHAHFRTLAVTKAESDQRVFVLEHCLSDEAIHQLPAALGAALKLKRAMQADSRLCWIVHAAEQGYNFDGHEYWDSFARRTPNWSHFGSRELLRDWFRQFAADFRGVRPSGAWGSHFTFIAWPITHALLPRDLQDQLARSLYDLRYDLGGLANVSAEHIGRKVESGSYGVSSRYAAFLQQHDLVGRIVQALLRGTESDQNIINRSTLERVIRDLSSRASARAWLRDAQRHYAGAQVQFSAPKLGYQLQASEAASSGTTHLRERGVVLRPTIELRRGSNDQWTAYLSIPSFRPLLNLQAEFKAHLTNTAVTVPSCGDSSFPGQALLSSANPLRIRHWPNASQCVLRFSKPNAAFDAIVGPECQFKNTHVWLFKRSVDGTAELLQDARLQPNSNYIAVSREKQRVQALGTEVSLDCEGMFGVSFDLPNIVPLALNERLRDGGFTVARCVQIRPVGLMPRQWSDEGTGEWLEGETPCLQVTRDHSFALYQFSVNGGPLQHVDCGTDPSSLLLLEGLPVGCHRVTVSTCAQVEKSGVTTLTVLASSNLKIFIRSPIKWSRDSFPLAAMVVYTEPVDASVDDVLTGRFALHVQGDSSRTATCTFVLTDHAGEVLTSNEIVRHRLPIELVVWRKKLAEHLKKHTNEKSYLDASGGYICVDAGDIGEYRHPLRHDHPPLRWMLVSDPIRGRGVRLANDGVQPSSIKRRRFSTPYQCEALDNQLASEGVFGEDAQGQFIAQFNGESTSTIVASLPRGAGLASLGAGVDVQRLHGVRDVALLVASLIAWTSAFPANGFSQLKQAEVCEKIRGQVVAVACGVPWAKAEQNLSPVVNLSEWSRLESLVSPATLAYAISLVRRWQAAPDESDDTLQAIHGALAERFFGLSDATHCRSAWQLAIDPAICDVPAVVELIARTPGFRDIVRGARLLHLCRRHKRPGRNK